ncbi:MAG: hypothetical protein A2W19_07925 [Spirochaetes bacterium RBG_16_49_21]|nr:MAG: hypothetical protein A2W19_07925 [Spirochaetes bacterium RBG_16_49_21]
MNKKKFITLLLIAVASNLLAEDYPYQYFSKKEKDKYVPFSDYIPQIRLHYQTVPHYLEDYYLLYGLKQYYNENTLRKNIERLKTALRCKFRHPSMALVKVETEKEYLKYRNLMFMHINLLIMRGHLSIASRYDKRKIFFYNTDFARDIGESLALADQHYTEALPYWVSAREYANKASGIKIITDLGYMETERHSIMTGDLDFGKIIDNYRKNIISKKQKLNELTAAGGL